MKILTLHMKKMALMLLAITATMPTSFCQKAPITNEQMIKETLARVAKTDTIVMPPLQPERLSQQQRLNMLTAQHFYFNPLGNQNLGLRFDTVAKSTIYEGLTQSNDGHYYTSVLVDGKSSVEIIAKGPG